MDKVTIPVSYLGYVNRLFYVTLTVTDTGFLTITNQLCYFRFIKYFPILSLSIQHKRSPAPT